MKKKSIGFKIGDYVKVKKGILDPENEAHCIENWQGKITAESISIDNEPLFLIKWDSSTLKNHIKCKNNEENEDDILKELYEKYDYVLPKIEDYSSTELGKQEKRIAELLKGINKKIEAEERWEEYLNSNLKFPFEAEIVDRDGNTEVLDYGDIVSVKKIYGNFDFYGVMVEARKGRNKYHIPLFQLEVKDKDSDNYIKVDDYNVWFANR